jgi:lysozyme family protein
MSALDKAALFAEYADRWEKCIPAASRLSEIDRVVAAITGNHARYEAAAMKLPNPPWWVIAVIHYRESDLSFACHLYNGDPLLRRTVHEPAGQPAAGHPPFTWEESAQGALKYDGMDKKDYSTIAGVCFAIEGYNGFGYRELKNPIPDPYLWAASNQQTPGKFDGDGHFNSSDMDRQLGCMTILKRLVTTGQLTLPPNFA